MYVCRHYAEERLDHAVQAAVWAAASLAGHLGRMQMQPDGRVVEAPREANQTGTYRAARLLECLERGEDPGQLALDEKRLAAHRSIKSTFLVGSAFGRSSKKVVASAAAAAEPSLSGGEAAASGAGSSASLPASLPGLLMRSGSDSDEGGGQVSKVSSKQSSPLARAASNSAALSSGQTSPLARAASGLKPSLKGSDFLTRQGSFIHTPHASITPTPAFHSSVSSLPALTPFLNGVKYENHHGYVYLQLPLKAPL